MRFCYFLLKFEVFVLSDKRNNNNSNNSTFFENFKKLLRKKTKQRIESEYAIWHKLAQIKKGKLHENFIN